MDYPANDSQCYDWFNTYFIKYLKKVKLCEKQSSCNVVFSGAFNQPLVVFPDGSMMIIWKDNKVRFDFKVNDGKTVIAGVNTFSFMFHPSRYQIPLMPDTYIEWVEGINPGFYDVSDRKVQLAMCKKFNRRCTGLLMHENWKIPDDYPLKF